MGSEITDDYISNVKISGNFVTANGSTLVQNKRNIKNRYVAPGYFIPENSFFYTEALADSTIQDKTYASDLPDDYTVYMLPVTFHSTYGCSIMSGNTIDLYIKADSDDGEYVMFDYFIKSVQVLAVLDSKGKDVFTESTDANPKPTVMVFGVPLEYYKLLTVAEKIGSGIEIIPVPRNANYSENPQPPEPNPAVFDWLNAKKSTMGDLDV